MRIITWNVNGIRAIHKRGDFSFLINEQPDIFCLQETKAEVDQVPAEIRTLDGYHVFFESSKARKGYSGVAIYTKIKPEKVEYSVGVPELDEEGRLIVLYFKNFVLLNCYFPNGGSGPDKFAFKLKFYDAFLALIKKLKKNYKHVIFCGDLNVAHTEIDIARPKENENHVGFLPVERVWVDRVIQAGFIDAFRTKYPNARDVYTWWDVKTRARDRNIGWRIDYFFVSEDLVPLVKNVKIWNDVYGSDHCPVEMTVLL